MITNIIYSAIITCLVEVFLVTNLSMVVRYMGNRGKMLLMVQAIEKQHTAVVLLYLILGILLFSVTFMILQEPYIRYISRISEAVQNISEGDLNTVIDVIGDDEFSSMAANLNHMAADIKKLMEKERESERTKNELITNVAHDLRTPLTSIIGSIDTVLNEGDHLSSDEHNVLLSDAKQDAEWLVRMVENLLSITRISGTEQTHIEKSPELVEEILGECLANFKKRNPEINLKVTIPNEPVLVNVDAMLIAQVIMNLLDNAAKHASGMTELRLDVTLDEKWVHFTVSDNGSGIDPKILPVLFRGQIDPEKGKPYDSNRFRGIGLAACQAIVSAHGGKISASNRPEGGAVFGFSLPAEEEEE